MILRLLFVSFLCGLSLPVSSQNKFSKKEVSEDLDYLCNSLKEAHYNVYAYVSEEKFKSTYHELKSALKQDSFSLLEATNQLQRLAAAVNNAHTLIDFPVSSYRTYAQNGGTVFPLEIAIENNKCLVRKNFSENASIQIGSELIRINGKAIADILAKIYPQIAAERPYFKNAQVEGYSFPRLYWQVFGEKATFEVQIRENGALVSYSLQAVPLIEDYEMKRTEVINAQMDLQFFDAVAYLSPGNFSGDESKFQRFIDSAFAKIQEERSEQLIIDLRNNGGGNDSFSNYLVSYIADRTFDWNSKFTLKTSRILKEHTRLHNDTTKRYFQEILKHQDGEIYEYDFGTIEPQTAQRRFTGEVYVLVNRQSYSQAAVTAAQIQDYGFGTIVGEETAEYPTLYASQFQYPLPRTGIMVKVSKGFIIRVNGSTKKEGVMPDIVIKDHLLDEKDEILNSLLQQLEKE
ncbi:MAG: S41 family peptidase [Saprospiraceae bacterium]|nr:S41 family peptidase [Saprospiraceae bacterium]